MEPKSIMLIGALAAYGVLIWLAMHAQNSRSITQEQASRFYNAYKTLFNGIVSNSLTKATVQEAIDTQYLKCSNHAGYAWEWAFDEKSFGQTVKGIAYFSADLTQMEVEQLLPVVSFWSSTIKA